MFNSIPLVSVCMITFKHERYIKQAIESVLDQETDFQVELIVSNDASPDRTDQIIEDIIVKHPKGSLIKYHFQKSNLGAVPNFYWTIKQAKGKYIALCEGDDYWTDPKKLATQVKSIESNRTFVGSFHDVQLKSNKSFHKFYCKKNFKINQAYSLRDFMENTWLVPTCSIVFRRDKLEIPDFFYKIPVGDGPLLFSLLTKGDFYLEKGSLGFYRIDNPTSIMNTYRNLNSHIINSYVVKILTWILKNRKEENLDYILNEIDNRNDKVIEKLSWLQNSLERKSRIYNFFKRFSFR